MAKLYFYYAAMNAGKSTALLQSAHNYQERGMQTVLFTPAIDNRHASGKIYSRLGVAQSAVVFDANFNLFDYVQVLQATPKPVHCVLVDEAQFLTKAQVVQLTEIVDTLNVPVLTFGLRSDFQGQPFPGSQYLLVWADQLSEIKTICSCGRKAIMNNRLDDQGNIIRVGQQVHIGDNDQYVSVCRKHFKQGGELC